MIGGRKNNYRKIIMIETKRLILRNYTMDDFNSLFEIMSDPETMQHYPATFDENRTKDWIIWNIENYKKYGFGLWAVTLKKQGNLLVIVELPFRILMVNCFQKLATSSTKNIGVRDLQKKLPKPAGTGSLTIQNIMQFIPT